MTRWAALAAYTLAIYTTLPWGPRLARPVVRSAVGGWLLGRGSAVLAAAAAVTVGLRLWRRGAPPRAWAALGLAGLGAAGGLAWLGAQQIERIHLPEYALAAVLAWRALAPAMPSDGAAYGAAAVLAAAIGWGDELLQKITPGRVYDLRDVAANALGALLGVLALAAWRAGRRVSGGSSARRSPPGAAPWRR